MNVDQINIWPLLAGLGLFLFGMNMLEDSLKKMVGRSFKKFLGKYTVHPLQAVLSGTLVTAVLQSSSMVTLLVMSFAGAGLIGLQNGIAMIMGANLGTTATGWLVSLIGFKFSITAFVYPMIAIGGIGTIFLRNERSNQISKFLMGFSFMFLGIDFMKSGFTDFAQHVDLSFLVGKSFIFFLLVGMFLSASMHSSSAAMMIILSSISADIISIEQGFYLVIGSDVGTTITAVIGTINGNSIRKKVGWSQFAFNIFTAIIGISFLQVFSWFILDQMQLKEPTIILVTFHSMFNLSGIIILLPLLKYFTRFIEKVIPTNEKKLAKHLMLVNPEETQAAIEALEKEARSFIREAIQVNKLFFSSEKRSGESPSNAYFKLKMLESEVVEFHMKIQQNTLVTEEVKKVNRFVASFRNATLSTKDLKDISHDLQEIRNTASDHLFKFHGQICESQEQFYKEILTILDNILAVTEMDIEQLDLQQVSSNRLEIELLHEAYAAAQHRDIDMPSMLNMLREINNSNEALLQSIGHLIEKD